MVHNLRHLMNEPGFILKLVEVLLLLLELFLWGLVHEYVLYYMDFWCFRLVTVAVLGYLIVVGHLLLTYIFDESPHFLEAFLMMAGALLHLAAGAKLVQNVLTQRKRTDKYAKKGVRKRSGFAWTLAFTLLPNSLVMLVDVVRETFKYAEMVPRAQ